MMEIKTLYLSSSSFKINLPYPETYAVSFSY